MLMEQMKTSGLSKGISNVTKLDDAVLVEGDLLGTIFIPGNPQKDQEKRL